MVCVCVRVCDVSGVVERVPQCMSSVANRLPVQCCCHTDGCCCCCAPACLPACLQIHFFHLVHVPACLPACLPADSFSPLVHVPACLPASMRTCLPACLPARLVGHCCAHPEDPRGPVRQGPGAALPAGAHQQKRRPAGAQVGGNVSGALAAGGNVSDARAWPGLC